MTEHDIQTLEVASVQAKFCVDTTIRMAHGLGYTRLMTPKITSTLDNGHLTAAQIIQHHEAIWAGRFLTFLSLRQKSLWIFVPGSKPDKRWEQN